jgi:DNA-binding response OmpR family regulator
MAIPILVVDDEPNFLELMKSALGKRGFDVNTASNGPDALKLLETELFDFALLDLKLGPADGIDLLAEIKRRQPRIRAIMVTGYPTDESRAEAKERGAAAYLSKPVELQDLFQTFKAVLTHSASAPR